MSTIQPEKIVEILKQHGTHVTIEQAKVILDFMIKMADIALQIYLKK